MNYLLNSVVKYKGANKPYIITLQTLRKSHLDSRFSTILIIDCGTHNLREKISEYSERRFSKQISRTYYYNNKNAKNEENEL
jgi:hypothetical protein